MVAIVYAIKENHRLVEETESMKREIEVWKEGGWEDGEGWGDKDWGEDCGDLWIGEGRAGEGWGLRISGCEKVGGKVNWETDGGEEELAYKEWTMEERRRGKRVRFV